MEAFTEIEKRWNETRPCGCLVEEITFQNREGKFTGFRQNRISGCSFHGMYGGHTNF